MYKHLTFIHPEDCRYSLLINELMVNLYVKGLKY